MTRGGQSKTREAPERRCIATGVSDETAGLIRFVLDPDGCLTPDLAERLPGRGAWLSATRDAAALAAKKRLFSRGFKQPVEVSADLPDQLEALLAKRLIEAISLTRKAGLAVNGFEKVKARLKKGGVGVLLAGSDGAEDGRGKLALLVGNAAIIAVLTSDELGLAFGRDSVVHAALDVGGATERVLREARRLDGFRQSG
ncbi:RNA-binding protein [Paracoccaceae bacterium]|nr:RNA-binding protein [Paracoccaceae bacterium]